MESVAGAKKAGSDSPVGRFFGWLVGRSDKPEVPPGQMVVQDAWRESLDTLVFVIILVLVLKTFVAECFVIPTGSMAETLYGYQKMVTCPECSHLFPVNCSDEVEFPELRGPQPFCTCPNCLRDIELTRPGFTAMGAEAARIPDPGPRTGDRVMVSKFHYDLLGREPNRGDVVVFKYPGNSGDGRDPHYPVSGPQKLHTPFNYIKRLMGKAGEVLAIHGGDLYLLESGWEPETLKDSQGNPKELWFHKNLQVHFESRTRRSTDGAFEVEAGNGLGSSAPGAEAVDPPPTHPSLKGKYKILRKSPRVILAESRIVYDGDKPAKDLLDHPRWVPDQGSGWGAKGNGFTTDATAGNQVGWLRYHHLLRGNRRQTADARGKATIRHQLITDVMGYNSGRFSEDPFGFRPSNPDNYHGSGDNWVSDLILEAQVVPSGKAGELILELSKGADRFQARFDVGTGKCALVRQTLGGATAEIAVESSGLTGDGKKHHVRFANVDRSLVVWVDGKLVFGDGIIYAPPAVNGPTANDLQPASIGVNGLTAAVESIRLWRDSYYTSRDNPSSPDVDVSDWTVPLDWTPDRPLPEALKSLQYLPARILRVPEGHYLCLGDNSANSSDSRSWGTVPRRLVLGRALLVYWPYNRMGLIR